MARKEPTEALPIASASIKIRHQSARPGGRTLLELALHDDPSVKVLAHDSKEGVHLALRTELPRGSALFGAAPDSQVALVAAGVLATELHAQRLAAQLVTGKQGIEAVIVSAHVCRDAATAAVLQARLGSIRIVASAIGAVLATPGELEIKALQAALRTQKAAAPTTAGSHRPFITATFDPAHRARMMERSAKMRPASRKKSS